MKKIKKCMKRILGIILTGLIFVNAISFTVLAEDDKSVWIVNSFDAAQLDGYTGTETDITLPTEVNGVPMTVIGLSAFNYNSLFTSIVVPEGYTTLSGSTFRECTALKSLSLPSSITNITGTYVFRGCTALEYVNLPSGFTGEIKARWFQDCSNPNLVINIQSSVISSIGANAFLNVTGTIKTYTQDVYNLVREAATTANVVLITDQFASLNEAIKQSTIYKQTDYTPSSFKVLSDAVSAGNALKTDENATEEQVEHAVIAINNAIAALVKRADLTDLNIALIKSSEYVESHYTAESYKVLIGAVTLGNSVKANAEATQAMSDSVVMLINYAMEQLVLKGFSELDPLIAQAEDLVNNHYDEYWIGPMTSLEVGLKNAKELRQNESALQTDINEQVSLLKKHIEKVLENKIDIPALIDELNQIILKAEELDENDYTKESYVELTKVLNSAKSITAESTASEINSAKTTVTNAINKLVLKPLDVFEYVQKGGKEVKVASLLADDSMVGVSKIKLTFNCANDVSFNESASIEVKATAGGIQSYKKFMGNSWETGAICEIELPLVQAIQSGEQVDISAFTYSWDNAADYVYGITKVEFINDDNTTVKKITAKTIEKETLAETISKAEAIDTAPYTDESVAELTKAIEAARALTDEATAEDINSAIKAIEDAISGLKLLSVTGTVTGTIKVSDANEETEMTVTAVSSDGTETTVTATSMGAYTIENLEAGSYTLTISGGKYAARSYELTVAEGENSWDAELNPLGDINGDGQVTTADVGKANSHAKGVTTLTDYDFACADVKTDGSITTADVGMINSHAKGVNTLW